MKKRLVVSGVVILVLLLGWVALSLTLLNDQWIKERLVEKVGQTLEVEVAIESASFEPWQGKAQLNGISVKRVRSDSDLDVLVESVNIDLALLPLLRRQVDVKRLELIGPRMILDIEREPEPEVGETLDRLDAALLNAIERILEAILEAFSSQPGFTIDIDELILQDGRIDVTARRDGVEPFVAQVKDLQYYNRNVRPRRPLDYLKQADLQATVDIADTSATVVKEYSTEPRRLSISGLDLGRIDKLLKQDDPLVIEAGTVDLESVQTPSRLTFRAGLTGLRLATNRDAPVKDFVFIPVDRLVQYVENRNGNLSLEYEVDLNAGQGAGSDDFRNLVEESWKGMWVDVLKRHKDEALDDLKDKATNKLRRFLGSAKGEKDKEGTEDENATPR